MFTAGKKGTELRHETTHRKSNTMSIDNIY